MLQNPQNLLEISPAGTLDPSPYLGTILGLWRPPSPRSPREADDLDSHLRAAWCVS